MNMKNRQYVNNCFFIAEVEQFDYDFNSLDILTTFRDLNDHKMTELVSINCFLSKKIMERKDLSRRLEVGAYIIIEGSFCNVGGELKLGVRRLKYLKL